jgi:mono/diheme cytochrome c family protein
MGTSKSFRSDNISNAHRCSVESSRLKAAALSAKAAVLASAVLASAVLATAVVANKAQALPFNDDMVHEQIMPGQFTRPRVAGTVPLGGVASHIPPKPEAANLVNPVAPSFASTLRGQRLYSVNCQGCHGVIGAKDYKPGVAGALLGSPNLMDETYKQKTAGYIFATIRYGGMVIMPGLGWKLSARETWDIVNYIQHVQTKGREITAPK